MHEILRAHDHPFALHRGSVIHVECSCGWIGEPHVWEWHHRLPEELS